MRKGWIKVDGVQDGDRTLEEQMLGLEPALAEAKGATVLDLGCAEGLIAREFARAGAAHVHGVEVMPEHVFAARKFCRDLPVTITEADLSRWIPLQRNGEQYDVVLSLSVAHKIAEPELIMRYSARAARRLLVYRGPGKDSLYQFGILKAKHGTGTCNVPRTLGEEGFELRATLKSARREKVEYWWRK